MSKESRPVPGLFGGISQQIPALRHPTQCEVQRNFLATVTDGLYTRPGTKLLSTLALTGANGASVQGSGGAAAGHYITRPDGSLYLLVVVNGNLMLYDAKTGAAQTVQFPDGKTYLNSSSPADGFAFITLADYTFIVNKSKVPAMDGSYYPFNSAQEAHIHIREAVANQTYTIVCDGFTATFATGATPTFDSIVAGLVAALNAVLPGASYTSNQIANSSVIRIWRFSGSPGPSVTLSDTWNKQCQRLLEAGVPTYADLPPTFKQQYTLTINGTAENGRDKYYVRWDEDRDRWFECARNASLTDPTDRTLTTLDKTTMPHRLYYNGSVWIFEAISDWGERLVGDDDTAPLPTFVGNPIRDIFFHRNRLGFLASDAVILSRSGEYFDFFPRTATQVLDTDPIDLSSPVDGVTYFAWAAPLNQALVIWTDTRQQLVLSGGDVLSPKSAKMIPTSTFDANPLTKPAGMGNRVLFAERAGDYATLGVYRVSMDTVSNVAASVTDHVPRLLPAAPRQIAVSTAARTVVVLPAGQSTECHVLRYELDDDGEKFTQKAWQTLEIETGSLTGRFIVAHWDGHELYLLTHYADVGDGVSGGKFYSEVLDFQRVEPFTATGPELCLDRRAQMTTVSYDAVNNRTTLSAPYTDPAMVFYTVLAGREPIKRTPYSLNPAGGVTTAVFSGDLRGTTQWAGVPYTSEYEFTEPILRDANGVPVQSTRSKLLYYLIRHEDSGMLTAQIVHTDGTSYSYSFGGQITGVQLPGALSLSSGDFRVPVQNDPKKTAVRLVASSVVPVRVPYAEWVMDVTMKARRA